MAKISLSPLWVEYYHKINELFKYDPEVRVIYDEDINKLSLYVDNENKASAIAELLPTKREFGNVVMEIAIIPANTKKNLRKTNISLIEAAFENNPIVNDIKIISGLFSYDLNYVIFKNCVVQYFNDSLGDYNGLKSTLYEDIARDVFDGCEGVFYCTDKPNSEGRYSELLYTIKPSSITSTC